MAKPDLKKEAIRLRVEGRHSLTEIRQQIPVSKAILSLWLRPYPLTLDELAVRRSKNAPNPIFVVKDRGRESECHRLVHEARVPQTTAWKGRVAEAAVLLRLVLRGFEPMRAVFEGDSVDWLVRITPTHFVRLQVRWAGHGKHGLPAIDLRRKGKSKDSFEGSIDFFVAYVLFNDTAYVYSWDEVKAKRHVSVCPEAAERWDKLQQGVV